jgi:hypothetical protein
MNGAVDYFYLLHKADVIEFMNLHKKVVKLSKRQQQDLKTK